MGMRELGSSGCVLALSWERGWGQPRGPEHAGCWGVTPGLEAIADIPRALCWLLALWCSHKDAPRVLPNPCQQCFMCFNGQD